MTHILDPKGSYGFQLINSEDGRRTPAFSSTPLDLCEILEGLDSATYVLTLFSEEEVSSLSDDKAPLSVFMNVPIFSARNWLSTFAPEKSEEIKNG